MRQLIDAGRGPRVIVIENVDTLPTSNKGADNIATSQAPPLRKRGKFRKFYMQ